MARRARPTRKSAGRREGSATVPEPTVDTEESERQTVLQEFGLLDTAPEERFDRICREVQDVLGAPATYISLLDKDRQWFKSTVGMGGVKETPRDGTFCDYAIRRSRPTVVLDATADPLFARSPYVTEGPKVRFYAGVPLWVEGQRVGTLCALDFEPRKAIGEDQLEQLCELAARAQEELARPSDRSDLEGSTMLAASLLANLEVALDELAQLPRPEALELLGRYVDLFSNSVERWGGKVENVGGVEFQAAFLDSDGLSDQAARAAGCAVELLRTPEFSELLAIGLHQGLSLIGPDASQPVFGWTARTARHLSENASAGEILASADLVQELGGAAVLDGEFFLLLPGLPGRLAAYRLVGVGDFGILGGNQSETDF